MDFQVLMPADPGKVISLSVGGCVAGCGGRGLGGR